ncbi:MAG: HAD hydrolase family protein, partial [Acidimicrobiia bacterium]
ATVGFEPEVVESYARLSEPVAKIVGVSDRPGDVAAAEMAIRARVGDEISAVRSQPYYLDVTNAEANKGRVIEYLSRLLEIPLEAIATLGDMPNDQMMFARSGMSIAMGNAGEDVKTRASHVTTSNDDDGFANAIDRFILGSARGAMDRIEKPT